MVNIDDPSILSEVPVAICDGIGLTRSEFLFREGAASEEAQLEVYKNLLSWADGRSVTVRTLDAGGDKPIAGITIDGESNPFLGVRGLRLSLTKPEIFKVQLRALLRAAVFGPLKIMLPMVTHPNELKAVKVLMNDCISELANEEKAFSVPHLGMMVEVPVAALAADQFDTDFYSIGTNDLIQYGSACARDNTQLTELARGDHPGLIAMIDAVVRAARHRNVELSVCGDMASDPEDVLLLLKAGIGILSVAPADVGQIKAAISEFGAKDR